MSAHRELTTLLNTYFHWNKARTNCFVLIIFALIQKQTVNLTKIAVAMGGTAKIESRYRRLQRFFAYFRFDYDKLATLLMALFDFQNKDIYLTLDRTNWKWGKANINILTLAVVHKGAAVPILWLLLNKRGNSNWVERGALLKRFIKLFGANNIKGLLIDREFCGEQWLQYLKKSKIPFYLRLKKNTKIRLRSGNILSAEHYFRHLKVHQSTHLYAVCIYENKIKVSISGLRLPTGELLIIAYYSLDFKQITPFKIYALRWEIEVLFGNLKGRGFKFEDTHIIKRARVKKMMGVLALVFCWAHKIGEWHNKKSKIPFKSHKRLSKSIFRYGLDYLDNLFSRNVPHAEKQLKDTIKQAFRCLMVSEI